MAHTASELQRDFEETSLAIASDVAASDDPTQWLKVLAELMQPHDGEKVLNAELVERLDMDLVPQLVQLLLSKSFAPEAVEHVNAFLQWCLKAVSNRLQHGDISRLPCVNRILDVHRRFYLYHTSGEDTDVSNQDGDSHLKQWQSGNATFQFALGDNSEYTSKYFVQNLECWGRLDGFSLFLDVLAAKSPVEGGIPFDALQSILRTLYAVKDYLQPVFLVDYFAALVDAVCAFVRDENPGEFYALPRDALTEVVQILELLLAKIQHDFDVNTRFSNELPSEKGEQNPFHDVHRREACEQSVQLLRLEISMRFFRSNSLEKRIYGLTEIVVVITRLYNDQIQEQPEPTAASLFATLRFLVDWMHEKRLMHELLGEKMHVELIKRSTSLFQFVSELECLPTEWIDLVWNCYHDDTEIDSQSSRPTQQRHEAFRATIHDLLLEMVEFMELPSLLHLESRVEMAKGSLDSNELGVLTAMAARRLLVEEMPQHRDESPSQCTLRQQILMHLWTTVLPAVQSEDFRDEILLRMHEILRLEVDIAEAQANEEDRGSNARARACSMINSFLSLCLENITQRKDLATSLKLLTQLASLVSEAGVVVSQAADTTFVEILLREVEAFKRAVLLELQGIEWLEMSDEERSRLPVLKDYVNDIKVRLLALRAAWILDERCKTGGSFAREQMDAVWELMINDSLLRDEAALCCQWIELCLNTPAPGGRVGSEVPHSARALIPLSLAKHLLLTKFHVLPGDSITLSTLCCFHSVFRRVNVVEGGLEISSSKETVGFGELVPTSPTGKASASSVDGDKDEPVELVTSQPLVGLDELWQLAVNTTNAAVAEEVITLLAGYHLAFTVGVRCTDFPFRSKMRFLEKCMEFISSAKANADANRQYASESDAIQADVAVVNRCVDLLRYFLEACSAENDFTDKEEAEALVKQLEAEQTRDTSERGDAKTGKKVFRLEHLEERLPYLEIFPSPMKDMQSDVTTSAMLGFRAARRPSWTFRQQHALLDVIEDTNEELEGEGAEVADVSAPNSEEETRSSSHFGKAITPLKIDPVASLLSPGSPMKPGMRSPCMRANLRWPQAPSPQHGPNLRTEDIDKAITAYASVNDVAGNDSHQDKGAPNYTSDGTSRESDSHKVKYGVMSQILSNHGSYFDTLLELVDWDEGTSQRVWDLLCRLPTNNNLLHKMICLRQLESDGEVDWSDLLDGSNTHRLLYSLRLVEALLIPIETESNVNRQLDSARRQWRERFVRLGGAGHVYSILLEWSKRYSLRSIYGDVSLSSQYAQNLEATCLAAVIRVLNYFFHWIQLTSSEKIHGNELPPFDFQLRFTTMPNFIKSIELAPALQAVVRISQQYRCQEQTSLSDEVAEAVVCSVQLSSSMLQYSPDLSTAIFAFDGDGQLTSNTLSDGILFQEWLSLQLVGFPSQSARAQLVSVLADMASSFSCDHRSASKFLFEQLVVATCNLVADASTENVCCDELFSFCEVVLGDWKRLRASGNESDTITEKLVRKCVPHQLMDKLCRVILEQESADIRPHSRRQHDVSVDGYLKVISMLAASSEQLRASLLDVELEKCFGSNSPLLTKERVAPFILKRLLLGEISDKTTYSPVCKTSASRTLAQNLVLSLAFANNDSHVKDCGLKGVQDVISHLNDYQVRVLNTMNLAGRQWNCAPSDALLDVTKDTRHAGLVNPGCICYMNALIQQLFMIPSFCKGLLALDCSLTESSWKEEIEQLQKLFVTLAYTNRRSTDPTAFALSHKDMDGECTDVHIQMDADEFFSLLLDRVEMFIRPDATSMNPGQESAARDADKDFMASCFGGVLVNQILTQQGNLSEREEKFFALSLEVSKKRHLTESLALYVQGESLEGENAYFCEREQRKVSATKRICIKSLPHTLVCHLKRFEFDYSTMEKMKINDYLEFPSEIDMYPYTSEGLAEAADKSEDDRSIMYDLVGVVVHSGTADTGHYYSFIKDRGEPTAQQWLEFNDEVVREFDVGTMGEECFGGEEVAQKWDPVQGTYAPSVQMKRRSAYMLIYEKRSVVSSLIPKTEASLKVSSQVKALIQKIMRENMLYESVVNAFEPTYAQLICDLLEKTTRLSVENVAVVRETYQLCCQFLFGISSLRCHTPSAVVSPSGSLTYPTARIETSVYTRISTHVTQWLCNYSRSTNDVDVERVQFSKWVLAEIVASPTLLPSSTQVESQRTWLFDTLFLGPADPEFGGCCFRVLSVAVAILKHRAAHEDAEAERSLLAFFRELLTLFYDREPSLDIREPVSGSVLTLSLDARVIVLKQLGSFLDSCIIAPAVSGSDADKEMSVLRRLFLDKLQFLSRFLQSLQAPCDDVIALTAAEKTHPSTSRKLGSLSIETSAASSTRADELKFCTLQTEMDITKHLLQSAHQLSALPIDDLLLLNHTALKNVLTLGFEGLLMPVLTRIAFESESKCDRLVALLIGLLEEVRFSYAEQLLNVLGALLDAEEAAAKPLGESSISGLPIHHHVFSPSRGILESAAYYRDRHALHDFIFVLLEFVVQHASKSVALQKLFRSDPELHDHVEWIPNWLADYLDANGDIRKQMKARDGYNEEGSSDLTAYGKSVSEARKLFLEMERAFGVAVPPYDEGNTHGVDQQELVITSPISAPVSAEDVVLEQLHLQQENQDEGHPAVKDTSKDSRRKINLDENGPELDGADSDPRHEWKLSQSREELSMLLRIDLDTTHYNAREA